MSESAESCPPHSSSSDCAEDIEGASSGTETVQVEDLPQDIWIHIASFLSFEDIHSLSLVSRSLNFVANLSPIWKKLYKKRSLRGFKRLQRKMVCDGEKTKWGSNKNGLSAVSSVSSGCSCSSANTSVDWKEVYRQSYLVDKSWARGNYRKEATFSGHYAEVIYVDFAEGNSECLLSVASCGELKAWDTSKRSPMLKVSYNRECEGPSRKKWSAVKVVGERLYALPEWSKNVFIYDLRSGEPIASLSEQTSEIISFDVKEGCIVTGLRDGVFKTFDSETGVMTWSSVKSSSLFSKNVKLRVDCVALNEKNEIYVGRAACVEYWAKSKSGKGYKKKGKYRYDFGEEGFELIVAQDSVYASDQKGNIVCFDSSLCVLKGLVEGHEGGQVSSMYYNGGKLATCSGEDMKMKFWSHCPKNGIVFLFEIPVTSQRVLHHRRKEQPRTCAFNPRTVACGSSDAFLRMWGLGFGTF
eukprot:Nk52_evm26s152 gene=Nk52_evmTU26s152